MQVDIFTMKPMKGMKNIQINKSTTKKCLRHPPQADCETAKWKLPSYIAAHQARLLDGKKMEGFSRRARRYRLHEAHEGVYGGLRPYGKIHRVCTRNKNTFLRHSRRIFPAVLNVHPINVNKL
jgi:hypothetical protein